MAHFYTPFTTIKIVPCSGKEEKKITYRIEKEKKKKNHESRFFSSLSNFSNQILVLPSSGSSTIESINPLFLRIWRRELLLFQRSVRQRRRQRGDRPRGPRGRRRGGLPLVRLLGYYQRIPLGSTEGRLEKGDGVVSYK